MKPYTTIQLNVKVTEGTADQIRKLAITHDITVAEQLRRFIEQGLSVQCYEQNIDLIASILCTLYYFHMTMLFYSKKAEQKTLSGILLGLFGGGICNSPKS